MLPCTIGPALPALINTISAATRASEPVVFFVAPNGNDEWSGQLDEPTPDRSDGPFATLARARDAIREVRQADGGIARAARVFVRAGTYCLGEPLVFAPDDSGTAELPVTYAAYRDETPVISGGRRITGWKPAELNGHTVWTAGLPQVKAGEWYFRELFVDGNRRPRTRLPEDGVYWFTGFGDTAPDAAWSTGCKQMKFAPGEIRADWHALSDVEIVAFTRWVDSRLPIESVEGDLVTFTKKSVFKLEDTAKGGPGRYWVENVREALDTPGQWYLDRAEGVLYYYPLPGETFEDVEVFAPAIDQLVRFEGTEDEPVEQIHLRNLSLCHAEWSLPDDASGAAQAAVNVPGAVFLQNARNCSVRGCGVSQVGTYAIELVGGCEGNAIVGNTVTDLGAGGVKVGHDTTRTTVSDNVIAHGGRIFHPAVGVWIGNSGYNEISHNDIEDFDYTGISVGWTWGYGESKATHNAIEYNHIHDLGHWLLSDMGGIYSLGISPGTRLTHNLIHGVYAYSYGGWGLYTDEGSSDMLLENNIVYNTKTGSFHQHYGRENVVRNNILAFAQIQQLQRTREEDHISFTFEHNIVYWKEGVLLGSNWTNGQYRFNYNDYWNARTGEVDFKGKTFEQWQATGQDKDSIIADPLFVDPDHYDFRLKPDSPALKLGFRPIDLSDVGPRHTGGDE